jgi:hypothetical protein
LHGLPGLVLGGRRAARRNRSRQSRLRLRRTFSAVSFATRR